MSNSSPPQPSSSPRETNYNLPSESPPPLPHREANYKLPLLPQLPPLTAEQKAVVEQQAVINAERQEVINARITNANGDNFSSAHVREQKKLRHTELDCIRNNRKEFIQNNKGNWICKKKMVKALRSENIFGELGPPQPPEIVPFADRCSKKLGKVWGEKSDGSWGCIYGEKTPWQICQEAGKKYGEKTNGTFGCINNNSMV